MVAKDSVLSRCRNKDGKFEVMPMVRLDTAESLSVHYTPGISYLCEEISKDPEKAYEYTSKSNTIAIVSDGTRILGLGKIGPTAGLPVMEGKSVLFKKFGGVNAVPICVNTTDEDKIVELVSNLAPSFGGINIEDIESPKSFRIASRLEDALDIPVFHDDRQGTGVVALAALLNALKLVGKGKSAKIIVNGAGSAGFGIVSQLVHSGFHNIIALDKEGAIYKGRKDTSNIFKQQIGEMTNKERKSGSLDDVVEGADVLIGASMKGAFKPSHIKKMADKPIVFALANPDPEISYDEAKEAGAYIVATGRSDYPNQVNNLLAFPGIMRGLLDSRAKKIDYEMLYSAAVEIANGVGKDLSCDRIIPSPLEKGFLEHLVPRIAAAVARTAVESGQARVHISHERAMEKASALIGRYSKIEKMLDGILY